MLDHQNSLNQTFSTDGLNLTPTDRLEPIRRETEIEATLRAAESAISGSEVVRPEDLTVCQPFSLIIPVYNEQDAIDQTILELKETFKSLQLPFEIIIVNVKARRFI